MPNFLSKLVKSPTHGRERSDSSVSARSRSRTTSVFSRSTTDISSQQNMPSKTNVSLVPSIRAGSISDTDSVSPNVTVIPPSPLVNTEDSLPDSEPENSKPRIDGLPESSLNGVNSTVRSRTTSSPTPANTPVTSPVAETSRAAAPTRPKSSPSHPSSRSPSPRISNPNLNKVDIPPLPISPTSTLDTPTPRMRHQSSNKSLNSQVSPITITSPPTSAHARAATTPDLRHASDDGEHSGPSITMTPISESPTTLRFPSEPTVPQVNGKPALSPPARDSDAVSIVSMSPSLTPGKDKKNRPWKRSGSTSKPSGLASAIAASGLAMANPVASQLSPPASFSAVNLGRRPSVPSPPMNRTPSGGLVTKNGREISPRSSKSKRSKAGSQRRRTSVSAHSDANSEYFGDEATPGVADYYSGLEDDSSEESDNDSLNQDDLMDLDLEDNAVTGFAVASNKRNSDFHELFPNVPDTDYLIEDYGCALQREILIQGRLYISENHICFHANIFGWITDLSIPISEIDSLEKKMTAFVIPNAIQITTRQAKYSFASFLSRDTTFDVIFNIWRLVRPNDSVSIHSSVRGSYERGQIEASVIPGIPGLKSKRTQCACSKEGKHYSETALDTVIPGTPDRIHNLIFTSGFIKEFFAVNQKLLDIQIADWAPTSPDSKLLGRNMSYIKPLNASVGPKQTKCEIRDETVYLDFDDYVATVTTTRTPDVPSGGVFSVKTRTCIMWASAVSTRVIVTTQVEWTGRSFIKGIIERSAIDGQKSYHADLEKAMRAYIQMHQSEFIPEGVDMAAIGPPPVEEKAPKDSGKAEDDGKKRERERNQRAFQWAYDTFDGALQVAIRSTKGALELVRDAWDQSSSTTMLYFVIVILVISNIYTWAKMGSKTEQGRRIEMRKMEDREKWIQGVVTALWDELASGKGPTPANSTPANSTPEADEQPRLNNWREEVASVHKTLDLVEERIRNIRKELESSSNQLDSLD